MLGSVSKPNDRGRSGWPASARLVIACVAVLSGGCGAGKVDGGPSAQPAESPVATTASAIPATSSAQATSPPPAAAPVAAPTPTDAPPTEAPAPDSHASAPVDDVEAFFRTRLAPRLRACFQQDPSADPGALGNLRFDGSLAKDGCHYLASSIKPGPSGASIVAPSLLRCIRRVVGAINLCTDQDPSGVQQPWTHPPGK
jgi:hypothetical protein